MNLPVEDAHSASQLNSVMHEITHSPHGAPECIEDVVL